MSTTVTKAYQLKKDGTHLKLTVTIGDAQKGVTSVTLGTNSLVSNQEGDVSLDIGIDNNVIGQTLYCSTTVTDIRTETKQTDVTYQLTGGVSDFQQRLNESVANLGDVVFYGATFFLI
jgi:hypothetical protein